MQTEPEIVVDDVPEQDRDAVRELVEQEVEKLERYSKEIVRTRVVVEVPHRTHRKGNLHHVSILIAVPGKDVVVGRDPAAHHAHEDWRVAVHDAFRAARRQLEDHVRRTHHRVKEKDVPDHGRIMRLEPEQGFGFIVTPEGREVYFHRNAVVEDLFDRLELGTRVRFTEADTPAEHGPHASTVEIEGRHHHAFGPE